MKHRKYWFLGMLFTVGLVLGGTMRLPAADVLNLDMSKANEKGIIDDSAQENNLLFPDRADLKPTKAGGPDGAAALSFNGGQYAFTVSDISLVPFSSLKLEVSVYQDKDGPATEQKIVRTGAPEYPADSWALKIVGNKLQFGLSDVGGNIALSDKDWTPGAWHKILVLYDGRAITLSVDGKEKDRLEFGSGIYASERPTSLLYFRQDPDPQKKYHVLSLGGIPSGSFFKGKVAGLKLSTVEPKPLIGKNLLRNGGFETGSLSGWNIPHIQAELDNAAAHSGKASLRMYLKPGSKGGYLYSQGVPAYPGATYKATFWIKADADYEKEVAYFFLGFNPEIARTKRIKVSKDWQAVEETVTLPASYKAPTVYLDIGIDLGYVGLESAGSFWIDDAAILIEKYPDSPSNR